MDNPIREILKKNNRRKALKRVTILCCTLVVLLTVSSLKLSVIAMTRKPTCGMSEHNHSAGCYGAKGVLICGQAEHTHTDACYQVAPASDDLQDDGGEIEESDLSLDDASDPESPEGLKGEKKPPAAWVDDEEIPVYKLRGKARLSTIIEQTKVNVKLREIVAAVVVDDDDSKAGPIQVTKKDRDYVIQANRSFDEAELALFLKDDVITICLVDAEASDEGDEVSTEDDEAPAEDDEVPVEDDDTSAENDEVTIKNYEAPVVKDKATVEDDEVSVKDDEIPSENDEAPAEDDDTSAENDEVTIENDEAPAVKDDAPAVEDEAPVEDDEVSVKDDEIPSEDDEAPAEGDDAPAEKDEVTIENDEAPAVKDDAPAVKDDTPVVEDEAPVEDDEVSVKDEALAEDNEAPAEGDEVSAEDDEAPVEDNEAPAEDDDAPAEDDEVTTEGDEAPTEDDEAPVEDNEAPAEDDEASAEDDEVTTEGDEAPTEDDEVFAEDNEVSAEDDDAPAEDDEVTTKGDEAPTEDDEAPVEDNEAPAEDDDAPAEDDEVTTEGDEAPTEDDEVSAEDNEVPAVGGETPAGDEENAHADEEAAESDDASGDSDGESSTEDEEALIPEEQDGEEEPPEQAEPAEGESVRASAPSGALCTATIDLAGIDAWPLSLRALMEDAVPAATDMPGDAEPDGGDRAEPPIDEWAVEYDGALLAIEREGDDFAVTPIADFETTAIIIENGSRFELTLVNCTLPEPEPVPPAYPAKTFEGSTGTMYVTVVAPEGAFPEGTAMILADVEDEQTISDIEQTVGEDFVEVKRVHAVDITFVDTEGNEIEPLVPVSVSMRVEEIGERQEAVVVHVDGTGEAEIVESAQESPAEQVEMTVEMPASGEALFDPPSDPATSAGGVTFEADTFSVYAVVFTETIETRYIDASGATWTITVGYGEEARLPSGAALRVAEIVDDEKEDYLARTAELIGGEKVITLARYFDITIVDAKGNAVQPKAPVTVNVALDDAREDEVCAVHFDEEAPALVEAARVEGGEGDGAAEDLEADVTFEAQSFSVWGIVYTVDFHYENGSEDAPKSFDFSLNGGGTVALSKLVEILGIQDDMDYEDIDAFLRDVGDVSFSNEDLVKVIRMDEGASVQSALEAVFDVSVAEEGETADMAENVSARDGDWLLVSLAPFKTAETLTITMNGGETIEILVTDDQFVNLAEFVTDAVIEIEGKTYGADETWNVYENTSYVLRLTLKEKGVHQFPQSEEEMVLQPVDLGGMTLVPGQSGAFDIPMGLYGVVTGNHWWVDDEGKLRLQFGRDPEHLLTRSNNAYVKLEFKVNFTGTKGTIQFNDTVTRDWIANTDADVNVAKSGHYNPSTGKMEYTITVTSTGNTSNITVRDAFATNALLSLNTDSITITPAKELVESSIPDTSNGFTRVIREMSHGETVTITYTADVNPSALGEDGRVTGDNGKNTVTIDHYHKETTNIVHEIKFSDLNKVTVSQAETADGKIRMNWVITANTERRASLVGSTISDRIDPASSAIMRYATSGGKVLLHVTGTDARETTYSRDIEVELDDDQAPESWTWPVVNLGEPEGTPLSYSIAYDTIVDRQTYTATVKNDATNSGGGSDTGVGIVPGQDPGGDTPPAIITKKEATAVTADYIDWNIVINVPDEGFPNGLTVEDEIPFLLDGYGDLYGFADRLSGAPTVSGLVGTETFKWAVEEVNKNFYRDNGPYPAQKLKIQFYQDYQDAEHNTPGLGEGPRTITISLTTRNDPKWVDYALTRPAGDTAYIHRNNGRVNETAITADAIPLKPSVKKELRLERVDSNGLPVYEYTLTLANVTEVPVVIEDTFDGDFLAFNRIGVEGWDKYDYIAAAVQEQQLNNGVVGYAATVTPNGSGKITITANDLPKKENGSFYEYYRIYYSLKVKDAAALAALEAQAVRKGGKYTLANTAVWGSESDTCEVDYAVTAITKEGFFATSNTQERKFTFVIDVNPGGLDLVTGGDTVELTDQHTENLTVDYSSVKIYEIPAGTSIPDVKLAVQNHTLDSGWLCAQGSIPWNFTGNIGTFTLEDGTHYVIVYDTMVLGTGEQKFSNNVNLEGFSDYKEGSRTYSGDVLAGGDIWELKLLKHKSDMTSKGLQGATFQLFKGTGEYHQESDGTTVRWVEDKEPMKYGDTQSTRARGLVGKNVTFTTGPEGLDTIKLDEVNDGNEIEGGVHYYLKEIEAPPGYQVDSSTEYWMFTLTTDSNQVNYGDEKRRDEYGNLQWVYFYYNDILKVANAETTNPLDVTVTKSWFDEAGNPIAGEDEELVAKVRLMRKTNDGNYVPVKVEAGTDGNVITEVATGSEEGQVSLTRENNWTYTWNGLPRAGTDENEELLRYAYTIEEIEMDGYVVSVSVTETGTVKTYALQNHRIPEERTTEVTVQKAWQDAEGETINGTAAKLPDEIQFELYRAVSTTPFTIVPTTGGSLYVIAEDPHLVDGEASEGDAAYGRYSLTKEEDWTTTFTGLPEVAAEEGQTYYYAYYVKEIPPEGYTVTYTSDGTTRTIVNREPLDEESEYIDIGLEKKWVGGDNTTPPRGASATFTINQQKAEVSSGGGEYTVKLVDMYDELIASVAANDGDTLTLDGYHFTDWQPDTDGVYANLHRITKYSYTGAGQLAEDWKGEVRKVIITVGTSMAFDNVITLKLVDKAKADFSTLPVLSNTSSGGSTSVSEYEDTGVTRTVTLPTPAGKWETVIRDLIQKDAEGNLYRYYITEDACYPEASSVAFTDQDGNEIRDESKTEPASDPLSEGGRIVQVTNTYETTEFRFMKEWRDLSDNVDDTWHDAITVLVQRRIEAGTPEIVGKYTIRQEDAGFAITKAETTPDAPDLIHDTGFAFRISDLQKEGVIGDKAGAYVYFATEETVSGYREATYLNPSDSSTEGESAWVPSSSAQNNGKIINTPENSIELPATGGTGTGLIHLFGFLLTGLAVAGLLFRRRRKSKA